MIEYLCPTCKQHPLRCRCPAIASDCSAADGGQSDVERSGNPKRSADRPAKISVFMVEADNVTQETMSSILRTLADHIDRTS